MIKQVRIASTNFGNDSRYLKETLYLFNEKTVIKIHLKL